MAVSLIVVQYPNLVSNSNLSYLFHLVRCTCSNCSVDFACKLEECICCQEIDRCGEVMGTFNKETSCITSHPGFQDVCLNKYVLEVAAIGLKTRRGKSYTRMFVDGQRGEAE